MVGWSPKGEGTERAGAFLGHGDQPTSPGSQQEPWEAEQGSNTMHNLPDDTFSNKSATGGGLFRMACKRT